MNIDYYFTVEEVAKIFRKTPYTVRKWAREGKIVAKKVGKSWLFSKSDIRRERSESDAASFFGNRAVRQPRINPFDLLVDGDRIEVKSSQIQRRNSKKVIYFWNFCIDFSSPKKGRFQENPEKFREYCDYFFFLCYNVDYHNLLRAYFIPAKVILKIMKKKDKKGFVEGDVFNFRLSLRVDDDSLEKYRVFKGISKI